MKIIRNGIIAGIAVLIASMAYGYIAPIIFPGLKIALANARLFRSAGDNLTTLNFLVPFLFGFMMSWVWTKVKSVTRDEDRRSGKEFNFTILCFAISIPIIVSMYALFSVNSIILWNWFLSVFVYTFVSAWAIIRFDKN